MESEEHPINHVLVEEVPNSQISQNKELEYNPFVSQDLSQAAPSNDLTQSTVGSQKDPEFLAQSVPVKKRRGRPPKELLLSLKPTRGSERKRKCTTVFNYESFHDVSWQWSERDKQLFLAGCLKVGIQDIQGLKRFLPHKTEYEIRSQVGMWKELACKNVEHQLSLGQQTKRQSARSNRLKNLDEWINYFKERTKTSNASTFVMSNIFLLIAEFGTLPSPKECGGIDVRAMYRYIHCMMNGLPLYGLNSVTSRVLRTCIDSVLELLNDANFIVNMEGHLFNTVCKSEKLNARYEKTYSRQRMNAFRRAVDQILMNPILNPLGLRESALTNDEAFQARDGDNHRCDDDDEDRDDDEDD